MRILSAWMMLANWGLEIGRLNFISVSTGHGQPMAWLVAIVISTGCAFAAHLIVFVGEQAFGSVVVIAVASLITALFLGLIGRALLAESERRFHYELARALDISPHVSRRKLVSRALKMRSRLTFLAAEKRDVDLAANRFEAERDHLLGACDANAVRADLLQKENDRITAKLGGMEDEMQRLLRALDALHEGRTKVRLSGSSQLSSRFNALSEKLHAFELRLADIRGLPACGNLFALGTDGWPMPSLRQMVHSTAGLNSNLCADAATLSFVLAAPLDENIVHFIPAGGLQVEPATTVSILQLPDRPAAAA